MGGWWRYGYTDKFVQRENWAVGRGEERTEGGAQWRRHWRTCQKMGKLLEIENRPGQLADPARGAAPYRIDTLGEIGDTKKKNKGNKKESKLSRPLPLPYVQVGEKMNYLKMKVWVGKGGRDRSGAMSYLDEWENSWKTSEVSLRTNFMRGLCSWSRHSWASPWCLCMELTLHWLVYAKEVWSVNLHHHRCTVCFPSVWLPHCLRYSNERAKTLKFGAISEPPRPRLSVSLLEALDR